MEENKNSEASQPKAKRHYRSRKKKEGDVAKSDAPKRKRGRPRKTETSAQAAPAVAEQEREETVAEPEQTVSEKAAEEPLKNEEAAADSETVFTAEPELPLDDEQPAPDETATTAANQDKNTEPSLAASVSKLADSVRALAESTAAGFSRMAQREEQKQPSSQAKTTPESAASLMTQLRTLLGQSIETVQYIEFNLGILMQYKTIENGISDLKKKNRKITQDSVAEIFERGEKKKNSVATYTFGALIAELSTLQTIDKKDLDELEELLQKRNYLVHQFFKVNDFEKQKQNREFLLNMIGRLNRYNNRVNNFNNMLNRRMQDKLEHLHKVLGPYLQQ